MIRTRKGKAWWGRSPSARKSARASQRKQVINKSRLSKIKTYVKKATPLPNTTQGAVPFQVAQKIVMSGVTKGVLTLNKASRIISRLSRELKKAAK